MIGFIDGELMIVSTSLCVNLYQVLRDETPANASLYVGIAFTAVLVVLKFCLYIYIRCNMRLLDYTLVTVN